MKLKKALFMAMLLSFAGCSKNTNKSDNETDDVQKETVLTKDENSQISDNKSEDITPETEITSEEIFTEEDSTHDSNNPSYLSFYQTH